MSAQENSLSGEGRGNSRAARMLAVLFVLVALCIAGGAWWYLRDSRERLLHELTQAMEVQAGGKAALLTVWSGSLLDQVAIFANQDMLRLFTSSARAAQVPAGELRRRLAAVDEGGTALEGAGESLRQLVGRAPLIRSLLKEFQEKKDFLQVALLDTDLEVLLAPGGDQALLPADASPLLRAALEEKKKVFLPVREREGKLVMSLAVPIFAPLYVDSSGDSVTALLLVSCDVLPVVRAATGHVGRDRVGTAILQSFNGRLYRLAPDAPGGTVILPGWQTEGEELPAAVREDPGLPPERRQLYTLARPVPYLPWLVAQGVGVDTLEERQAGLSKHVTLLALLLAALAGVVLMALWWAMVGRNERAVAQQMRRLYLMLNQQKQIMDGVNAALSAGVVLNDMDGVLFYANQGFAALAGKEAAALRGLRHTDLGRDLARSLVTHTLAVHRTGARADFTEALSVGGQRRFFLAVCTPFRDEAGRITGVVSVYNDITSMAEAQRRAQRMVTQTVHALARSIEAVDAYLCGQSERTAQLACLLAVRLGRGDAETLATLRAAASLSQVGMIRLPRELRAKTGALTAEERTLLHRHVDYAREALGGMDFGLPVLPAITQMYERMDGSGYPAGLAGEAICFNARVLAVANTFCALMRPRSYRMARTVEDALGILGEQPPKYDSAVVEALRALLDTDEGRTFLTAIRGEQKG